MCLEQKESANCSYILPKEESHIEGILTALIEDKSKINNPQKAIVGKANKSNLNF
jgi:hypothetical protein